MSSLEHKITPGFLMKFTLPTMIMMVFNSFYTMVDGGFVSNFVGTSALSAVNIVYPVINFVFAVGIMLATGGSAIVARLMGEKKPMLARQSFSLITVSGVVMGLIITVLCICFTGSIVHVLGANDAIYGYCYDYAFYLSLFIPFAILQLLFQFFFVTAGRPNLGLWATVAGGVANIVLDYLFIVPLNMGIKGAAIATGIGYAVPSVIGLIYFSEKGQKSLSFAKPVRDLSILRKTCTNGSSEMVSNLAVSVTTFLFNRIMMDYLGEDGVAAMTIVVYAQFLFTAIFLGYTSGAAPLFSFNYGAQDKKKLHQLFRISMIFIAACSVIAFGLSIVLSDMVIGVFAASGSSVFELAKHGMYLFAAGFLFMGFNIFASGLFTALSNGRISAILSFLRTFVFLLLTILLLPLLLEVNGVWLSIPAAELMALVVALIYILKYRKVYGY